MLIRTPAPSEEKESNVTPEKVYFSRRQIMGAAGALGLSLAGMAPRATMALDQGMVDRIGTAKESAFSTAEKLTPLDDIKQYANFYEFGSNKDDPDRYADQLKTDPWSVTIDGEVEKPGTLSLEDILKNQPLEERIYRLRCVEAWSMVVPWIGFPLADLLKRVQPTSKAKYVAFQTLYNPEFFPGQRSRFSTIEWPYVEGLRIDEAMHPLTILSVGLYGKVLPNQNGAPIRLVVPWKYGFKSIKSIVKISLVEKQPPTSWSLLAPREYGFYSNVNPQVDHPRWSQKSERRLPGTLFSRNRIQTRMFNGYDEVASLYAGMDLKKNY